MDVTEKVVGFLDHTKTLHPNASFKTAFKDMEVNEAMWTLEAACNYLVNKNMKYMPDADKQVLKYSLNFDVFKREKEFAIKGESLTAQFDELFSDIRRLQKKKISYLN